MNRAVQGQPTKPVGAPRNPLAAALATCRGAGWALGGFSGVINILTLSGSIFMLQVYDRVLPSRSVPTLLAMVGLVALLYAFQGVLEMLRARILVRISRALDERLARQGFSAILRVALRKPGADGLQPMRDLDQVRGFLASNGPTALFDLPWMPLYLGLCFLFHPLIGLTTLAGALLLMGLTLLTEMTTRTPVAEAARSGAQRHVLAEASRRNAEALVAMGMAGRLADRWERVHGAYMDQQQRASDAAGGISSVSRVLRMMLQSGVLAVGAYLVIQGEATAGIIIASSILTSRALAPVELAIANWKSFLGARNAWHRLSEQLETDAADPMALPAPSKRLSVEAVSIAPPGQQKIVVQDVTLALEAGQGLGIIGPSASGKSSLARAMVGVWLPQRGKIRLDGASLDQWSSERLGAHVGYLPQDIELFDGTVAENIARFTPDADPAGIVAAARAAGVHDLILRLPQGYETRIGEAGGALSAGQRQRVALARALYGDPFLVVLDEPNSNLDVEGDSALTEAIVSVRRRGGIVIVVAHRPAALAGVDLVAAMAGGQIQAFGPKEETLRKVLRPAQSGPAVRLAAEGTPAA